MFVLNIRNDPDLSENSELPCKTQLFKTVAHKYSPNDISIILFWQIKKKEFWREER